MESKAELAAARQTDLEDDMLLEQMARQMSEKKQQRDRERFEKDQLRYSDKRSFSLLLLDSLGLFLIFPPAVIPTRFVPKGSAPAAAAPKPAPGGRPGASGLDDLLSQLEDLAD